jgi:aerobic carbon-monoxide dehydrogenase medium subunit
LKPAPFQLHLAESVEEATWLLAEHGDDAKLIAGGQSLMPLLALRLARYDHLVDMNRVGGLSAIERQNGWLQVGAMVRQAQAERDGELTTAVPLLSRALPHIGHFQIRNRGTIGGSTAHGDPASELPAVAVALDAEMVAASQAGTRVIPARDFFVSTWTTALASDELLAWVRYPVWSGRNGWCVEEFARRSGDFAIAGVACGVALTEDDTIQRAAIALFGMGPTPLRAGSGEACLVGQSAADADLVGAAAAAVAPCAPADDIHGPATFRRRVARYLTEQALRRAIEEASNARP